MAGTGGLTGAAGSTHTVTVKVLGTKAKASKGTTVSFAAVKVA